MKNEVLNEKDIYMVIDRSTVFLVLKFTLFIFFFFVKQNSVNITFYSDNSTIGTQMSKCFKNI